MNEYRIDSDLVMCFDLGKNGSVRVTRKDNKNVEMFFFKKISENGEIKDVPMHISSIYPDEFWKKDYFTTKMIKKFTEIYNLENGAGFDMYARLRQQLHEKKGIPTIEMFKMADNKIIEFKDIDGNDLSINVSKSVSKKDSRRRNTSRFSVIYR